MTELKLIVVGLGGQGVVFLTRLLSQAAIALGQAVLVSETHGMSQRGGTVISHVKLGGSQAPLIQQGTADLLLALEPDEAVRHLTFLRQGGLVFVNSENGLRTEVAAHLERLNIRVFSLPAGQMAMKLGSAAITNVILAGFAAAHPGFPLPIAALRQTVADLAPRGQELNLRALEAGYNHFRL
jgi:indolepyruvate ferredoxin oxidoreductase beta subunit